jgi:hypothetical protein
LIGDPDQGEQRDQITTPAAIKHLKSRND